MAFASLVAGIIVGNIFILGLVFFGSVYAGLACIGFQEAFWPICVCYGLYALYSNLIRKDHHTGRLHWPAFNKTPFWEDVFRYFQAKHIIECELKPGKQYIVACHPHGIHCLPLGMFSWLSSPFRKRFPHHSFVGLAASVIFWIPILREIFLYSGYRDASRRYAERALAEGNSLYLCTGGEAESLLSEKGKDKVVLSHRKGFIRLALSYGADLVPTYGFGNTDTYATYGFGLKFRLWLSKNFQIALPLFHGRWLTMTPYPATLTVVSGPAIEVPVPKVLGGPVDDALVQEYLDRYIQAVKTLYDTHKAALGMGDRKLEVH